MLIYQFITTFKLLQASKRRDSYNSSSAQQQQVLFFDKVNISALAILPHANNSLYDLLTPNAPCILTMAPKQPISLTITSHNINTTNFNNYNGKQSTLQVQQENEEQLNNGNSVSPLIVQTIRNNLNQLLLQQQATNQSQDSIYNKKINVFQNTEYTPVHVLIRFQLLNSANEVYVVVTHCVKI